MVKAKSKIMRRTCAVCGKKIEAILYSDRSYRGGHYFGKVPDKKLEYWECPKCYW